MLPTESSGTRLTLDDFALFPDDGLRHELIDGEHYVTPSPTPGISVSCSACTSRLPTTFG